MNQTRLVPVPTDPMWYFKRNLMFVLAIVCFGLGVLFGIENGLNVTSFTSIMFFTFASICSGVWVKKLYDRNLPPDS